MNQLIIPHKNVFRHLSKYADTFERATPSILNRIFLKRIFFSSECFSRATASDATRRRRPKRHNHLFSEYLHDLQSNTEISLARNHVGFTLQFNVSR